jgi:hypothetical protein
MACDGCGTPSRLALAMAKAAQPGTPRLCWTCARGGTAEAEERFITGRGRRVPRLVRGRQSDGTLEPGHAGFTPRNVRVGYTIEPG